MGIMNQNITWISKRRFISNYTIAKEVITVWLSGDIEKLFTLQFYGNIYDTKTNHK